MIHYTEKQNGPGLHGLHSRYPQGADLAAYRQSPRAVSECFVEASPEK